MEVSLDHFIDFGENRWSAWLGWPRVLPPIGGPGSVEMILVLSGDLNLRVAGSRLRLPLQRLCVVWAEAPREVCTSLAGVRVGRATVPLAELSDRLVPRKLRRVLLSGGVLAESRSDPTDEPAFGRWADDLSSPEAPHCKLASIELGARLRRFFMRGPRLLAQSVASGPQTSLVERMRAFLDQKYPDSIGMDQVAQHVGLHPNYAMSLFRQETGMTILAYLTRRRVQHAQHLLVTSDLDVPEISRVSGFGSISRFYATFKKSCGQTPRTYRVLCGAKRNLQHP